MDKNRLPTRDGIKFDKTLIMRIQELAPKQPKKRLTFYILLTCILISTITLTISTFFSERQNIGVSKETSPTINLPLPTTLVGQEQQ